MTEWLKVFGVLIALSVINFRNVVGQTQLEVTTAVFLPVKNGSKLPDLSAKRYFNTPIDATSYNGESSDFPIDASSVRNKFFIDNLKPAHEVAFRAALADPAINIKFTVDYYLYLPCVAKVGWYSLKQLTLASRRPSPQNGKRYDVFFGPPCFTDALQAGIITMSYPVLVASGSVTLADTLEPFVNMVRCSYSTFTQWSLFMRMTATYNWTSIAIFYDDSTASISVWANSLMTRCNSRNVSYTQFSLTANAMDLSTMLNHARKLSRSR
ncbi:hypothetical protein RvY_14589 [Ramazzottius varieornatus]|uniref:Receptor ligand binding region domain-containing protein n=1 Tax=Ramazzottius varieornatus TaxID=947166 RepID=A0A1D1VTS3_RAMVA|nr:hypothetical protein RvY_14589 [Ramazzottius varieornatus]